MTAANLIKESNPEEKLACIKFLDEVEANVSGGTLETVMESIFNPVDKKSNLGFDPLLKLPGKQKSTS